MHCIVVKYFSNKKRRPHLQPSDRRLLTDAKHYTPLATMGSPNDKKNILTPGALKASNASNALAALTSGY
jgi:hypothetical protein